MTAKSGHSAGRSLSASPLRAILGSDLDHGLKVLAVMRRG
jgi:hypothetical protein